MRKSLDIIRLSSRNDPVETSGLLLKKDRCIVTSPRGSMVIKNPIKVPTVPTGGVWIKRNELKAVIHDMKLYVDATWRESDEKIIITDGAGTKEIKACRGYDMIPDISTTLDTTDYTEVVVGIKDILEVLRLLGDYENAVRVRLPRNGDGPLVIGNYASDGYMATITPRKKPVEKKIKKDIEHDIL